MDPHRTQVLQHLESFKEAYSSKDYGACTDLLSRLNGILIEKTSQGRVKLSKTVAGIEEKEQTENKLEDPEDFLKIPLDMEYIRTNPFGDMTAVENGEDDLDDMLSEEGSENIDENNENLEENKGNLDENNHDRTKSSLKKTRSFLKKTRSLSFDHREFTTGCFTVWNSSLILKKTKKSE